MTLYVGRITLRSMNNVHFDSISSCKKSTVYCIVSLWISKKLSFPTSNISKKEAIELIHIDIWGPYKAPTHDVHRFFLTIVDYFSKGT